MPRISRESLLTLEAYARARPDFRARLREHRRARTVLVGNHVTLIFEDELTVRYQIQEMLRAERIFEEEAITAELEAYNPLVPDGTNWKATMLIAYADEDTRREMLAKLIGIEDRVWMQVSGWPRVYAIADEDLDRGTPYKTAAVHFLRFEVEPAMSATLRRTGYLAVGIDHPHYRADVTPVDAGVCASLVGDLDPS